MAPLYAPLDSYGWHTGQEEEPIVYWLCVALAVQLLISSILLFFAVEAWYGRYNSSNSGINPRLAWFLQEGPTLVCAVLCWSSGRAECKANVGNCLVLAMFVVHYFNRTFIFPLRFRGSKPVPISIVCMASCFCAANGYIQCKSLTKFLMVPLWEWTTLLGALLWALGFYINLDSDQILRQLRAPGETGYKIPRGGMFEYISGANFFGEILEWLGYALAMGGALPGATFALCTVCNIGPRAVSHHRWYLQKFAEEYPKNRKALIPFIY